MPFGVSLEGLDRELVPLKGESIVCVYAGFVRLCGRVFYLTRTSRVQFF
jgi:hypothetical protein